MIRSQTGQAMLETLLSFPTVAAILSAVTVGIYLNLSSYLVDHWTQESALCLAKTRPKNLCLKEFKSKVEHLAFIKIQILSFNRSSSLVFVKVQLSGPARKHQTITYNLPWPVQSL